MKTLKILDYFVQKAHYLLSADFVLQQASVPAVYQEYNKGRIPVALWIRGKASVWESDMRVSVLYSMFRLSTSGRMGCGGNTGKCTHIFFFFLTPLSKSSKMIILCIYFFSVKFTGCAHWVNVTFVWSCSSQMQNGSNPMKVSSVSIPVFLRCL